MVDANPVGPTFPDNILVNCVAPGYTRTARIVALSEQTAARERTTPDLVSP